MDLHRRARIGHCLVAAFTPGLLSWLLLLAAGQCPTYRSSGTYAPDRNLTGVDNDLVEFALNLEYLEAEFFLWSALGFGLDEVAPQIVAGAPVPLGGQMAALDGFARNLSLQFGLQQVGHIRAILETIEGFQRPLINISAGVFAQLMNQAFGKRLDPPFDPYQDSLRFMIASYALPYVALTGYVGMSPSLESSGAKRLVAGLLGAEAGQDAAIRGYLYAAKDAAVEGYAHTVAEFTAKISELWDRLAGSCLGPRPSQTSVLSADGFSLSFGRTAIPILRIVYGSGAESVPGAFFPHGARGIIAQAALQSLGRPSPPLQKH